jgi:hypothetical protein
MATRFSLVDQFKVRRPGREAPRSSRSTLHSQGWIRMEGDFAVLPCVVVDVSQTGARLRVETSKRIADNFNLQLSRRKPNGHRCQVKWRRGEYLGVKFV